MTFQESNKARAKKQDWQKPAYRRKVLAARAKTLDRKMKERLLHLANFRGDL